MGCLVFEMLVGTPPFVAEEEDVLFYKIVDNSPVMPEHASDEAVSLIQACMHSEPSDRLDCASALALPWLAQAFRAASDG